MMARKRGSMTRMLIVLTAGVVLLGLSVTAQA